MSNNNNSPYRPRIETDFQPPVLRRSLRILAKQKLREEQQLLQQSASCVPVLTRRPPSVPENQGTKVNVTKTETNAGSSRKRKRSISPKSLGIPKKQVRKRSRERQDQRDISRSGKSAPVVATPEQSAKKKGHFKEANVEKGVSCPSNTGEDSEPGVKERESQGTSTDKRRQKRKNRPRKLKETELASVLSGFDRESGSKGQKLRAGNKGKSRGKQGKRISWKKGSHLTMASPE